jgi:hypothetical protein
MLDIYFLLIGLILLLLYLEYPIDAAAEDWNQVLL